MGEVVGLPLAAPRAPDCRICEHSIAADQTYCWLYQEVILNERSAAHGCELFTEDKEK